jgi:hypothetical protein
MNVRYAILQTTLDAPDVEKLRRALRGQGGLVAADAGKLAKNAHGILVRGLSADHALALRQALAVEGLETVALAETLLPALPPPRFVNRLEYRPEGLLVHDRLGHQGLLGWPGIALIAAGAVHVTEFTRQRVERTAEKDKSGWIQGVAVALNTAAVVVSAAQGMPMFRGARTKSTVEYSSREKIRAQPLVEILVRHGTGRFSIEVDESPAALFGCLGERASADLAANFALLVQDLLTFAPHAIINRGAHCLREKIQPIFSYPSRNAFHDEITWLLWRLGLEQNKTARGGATPEAGH